MAGFLNTYILYISVVGVILLTFLSFCCFINMEALKLSAATNNKKGFATLVAAIVIYH
jgi:hypothetical protein